ncbi:LysR family transcriptional regulator [Desulfosporosinus fructosivorans]
MDYKQLEAFEALLKYGTYSKAAKAIYISQPAMTVRIQSLEKFLDIPLFKRNGHKYTLTVAGTVFSNYVRDIFNLHKESLQAINELKGFDFG